MLKTKRKENFEMLAEKTFILEVPTSNYKFSCS